MRRFLGSFGFRAYGTLRHARNLLAVFLALASPVVAEPHTVAALGDSLTQGYGLPADQGFVPQLEAWLRRQGADVELVNAGVSGDTTQGGLSRVEWTLTPEVDALIVALGGNDLLRGIDPTISRANLVGILAAAAAADVEVLLIGMSAPGNYGPDYKAAFDAIYPELADDYDALLVEDFLAPLLEVEDRETARREYMQSDGIHPNALGVALIVEAIGPKVVELLARLE